MSKTNTVVKNYCLTDHRTLRRESPLSPSLFAPPPPPKKKKPPRQKWPCTATVKWRTTLTLKLKTKPDFLLLVVHFISGSICEPICLISFNNFLPSSPAPPPPMFKHISPNRLNITQKSEPNWGENYFQESPNLNGIFHVWPQGTLFL